MAFTFDGFDPSNTTPVPDVFFDVLLPHMNEAQLKVMLYIIRRTLGFKKTEDAISLKQFRFGIVTREKKQLDEGCGLKNFTTISKALKSLEAMNCIEKAPAKTDAGDDATTVYKIHFRGTTRNVVPTTDNVVRDYAKRSTGTTPSGVGVLRETYPQETVIQQTDLQETVRQESTVVSASAENDAPAATIHDIEIARQRKTDPRIPAVNPSHSQCLSEEETVKMPAVKKGQGNDNISRHLSGDNKHHSPGTDYLHEQDHQDYHRNDQTTRETDRHSQSPLASQQTIPALGSPDAAQRTVVPPASRGTGTTEARSNGAVQASEKSKPKSDTKEIQRRINEHRGYQLEEQVEIIRERKAIKSWCNLHTLEEYSLVMAGAKKDKYWGKQENYYRIGGLTLLKITPEILARQRQPLPMVANGNGHSNGNQDGLVYQGDLVLWNGQWMTEEEADKTGYNGGFGLYK